MLEEQCSIYASAKDRIGIGQMSIRDFLFSGRWKEPVLRLRRLVAEYGALEAKKRDDYRLMKQRLPGATLSGLFSRRKGDCLICHTGYIALDIDLADNATLGDFRNIEYVLRHRPEVACYLRSCSGTGYFALVRLGYPDKHKEQFAALREEYGAMGVELDKACSDITRIRFATYDEEPFINERAIGYRGIALARDEVLAPKAAVRGYTGQWQGQGIMDRVDRLVSELERNRIDITANYQDWIRIGFSLATLGEAGRQFYHRVSAMNPGYKPRECDSKFSTFPKSSRVGIGTFIGICQDYGIV